MLKKIQIYFHYDGTQQGNADRNALQSLWNTEKVKTTVTSQVVQGDVTENSAVTVNGNILIATIFYNNNEAGIADWTSFWNSLVTEYNKSTVIKTNNSSHGQKHDHNCVHDDVGLCSNFTHLS